MKKILMILVVLLSCLSLTGCATKNDVDMYEDYVGAIEQVSSDTLEYFSQQLTILATSIPLATTPLERHLIRQSIMDLHMNIQEVIRATGTNDVLTVLAERSDKLLKTAVGAAVIWKGLDVAGEVLESSGGFTTGDNGTINYSRNEEHTTAIGDEASSTSKADPIVVEVPVED